MKVLARTAGIGLLSGAVLFVTVAPAEALPTPLIAVALEAATVVGDATVVAGATGLGAAAGPIVLAAIGTYAVWSHIPHHFSLHVPFHTGDLTDLIGFSAGTSTCSTYTCYKWSQDINGQRYTQQTPLSVDGWGTTAQFNSYGTTDHLIQLHVPTFNNPTVSPYNGNYTPFVCAASYTGPGGTGTVVDTNQFATSSIAYGATGVQVSICNNLIQTAINAGHITVSTGAITSIYVTTCVGGTTTPLDSCNDVSSVARPLTNKELVSQYNPTPITPTVTPVTTCTNGTTTTQFSGATVPAQASGNTSVDAPACTASGYWLKSVSIVNNNGASSHSVFNYTNTVNGTYPLCGGANQCALELYYNGVVCDTTIPNCTNWYNLQTLNPTWYSCHWGTYTLPTLNSCQGLRYQYAPDAITNSDGFAVDSPTVDPNYTAPAPSNTNDLTQSGTSTSTDLGFLGCAPSGWNILNPFAFVGETGCLIKWTLIPDTAQFATQVSAFESNWNSSSIGTLVNAVAAVPLSLSDLGGASATGCDGPSMTLDTGFGSQTMHPFSACNPPLSTIAPIARTMLGIFWIVFGVLGVWNPIARAFGIPELHIGRNSDNI